MPKAIETQIAPAVRAYTNIPSKAGTQTSGGSTYKFQELGPKGQVIDDPEEFASLEASRPAAPSSSYMEYAEKLKSDMGDPYEIDVNKESVKLLAAQEREIFREWSGGQYQFPGEGYLPPKAKKAWGEYRQRLLANAQKIIKDNKVAKIKEYEQRLTEFKTNQEMALQERQEQRLKKGAVKQPTGVLTENEAMKQAENLFPDFDKEKRAQAVQKFIQFMTREDNTVEGKRRALLNTIKWAQEEAAKDDDEDKLKDLPGSGKAKKDKTEKAKRIPDKEKGQKRWFVQEPGDTVPPGYVNTGRFSGGKPVYEFRGIQ